MGRRSAGEAAAVASLLVLLLAVIGYPLLEVLAGAFVDGGRPAVRPLLTVFAGPLFREALLNTLLAGVLAVAIGSVVAVPLAVLTARHGFPGRTVIGVLGVVPLAIPPFVAAVGFQQILGRSGVVNLVLREHWGFTVPFMEGLAGVVLVQSLHFFPLIFLTTAAALGGLDRSLEEAARNLGASGFRLFRRVLLPLVLPGYAAGALLTFIGVIDDLGAPLMLSYTPLLAPAAYARVTTVGLTDVDGSALCLALVVLSVGALGLSRMMGGGSGCVVVPGRIDDVPPIRLGRRGALLAWLLGVLLLGPALLPLLGIALLSVSQAWSLTPLPTGYTAGHYGEILVRSPGFLANTLRYALLAAVADVALGAAIAWLLLRGRGRGRHWLAGISTVPLAVPGVVIALGYLRAWSDWRVPGLGEPLTSTWLILVIVYAVRGLPYAVHGAHAALRHISPALEEAAQGLGASPPRAFVRITRPLMTRGLLAGGLLVFIGAAVDLSATMLLVPRVETAPLSYGLYVLMQSAAGRGPGAALGVVAIALVAAGAWAAAALARRPGAARWRSSA